MNNGFEKEQTRQEKFLALAEKLRAAKDPEEAKRLGDEPGRMVFRGARPNLSS